MVVERLVFPWDDRTTRNHFMSAFNSEMPLLKVFMLWHTDPIAKSLVFFRKSKQSHISREKLPTNISSLCAQHFWKGNKTTEKTILKGLVGVIL